MLQICQNIRQARELSGKSQEAIADKMGIKRGVYKNWEINTEPDLETINKIGRAIGIPPISLLAGIIEFTEKQIVQAENNFKSKKENEVVVSLAKLTSAIGQLVGLDKERIFDTVLSSSLDKTEVGVSQQLSGNKAGRKNNSGN